MSLGRLKSQFASSAALIVGATALIGVSATIFFDALNSPGNQPKINEFALTDRSVAPVEAARTEKKHENETAIENGSKPFTAEKSAEAKSTEPAPVRESVGLLLAEKRKSDAVKQSLMDAAQETPKVKAAKPRTRSAYQQIPVPKEIVEEFEEALDFQAITKSLRQNFYVAVVSQWEKKVAQQSVAPLNTQTTSDARDGLISTEDDYSDRDSTTISTAPETNEAELPKAEKYSAAEEMGPEPSPLLNAMRSRALEVVVPSQPISQAVVIKPQSQQDDTLKSSQAMSIQIQEPKREISNTQNQTQPIANKVPQEHEDYPLSLTEETRGLASAINSRVAPATEDLPNAQALKVRARVVETSTQLSDTQSAAQVSVNTQLATKNKSKIKTSTHALTARGPDSTKTLHNAPPKSDTGVHVDIAPQGVQKDLREDLHPEPTTQNLNDNEDQQTNKPDRSDQGRNDNGSAGVSRYERDASSCRNINAPIYTSFGDGNEALPVAQFTELTREDPAGICARDQYYGWTVSKAPLYWNTVFWSNQRAEALSHNQAMLFAATAQTQIQSGTAIIYGRVPAGYRVALSGRAEAAVYLNSRTQPIAETDDTSERYFSFVNVAPGSQLLYFIENKMGQPGAVGVPAVADTATYIDLRQVNESSIQGFIFDAASAQEELKPLPRTLIEVIGYDGLSTFSKEDGSFEISRINMISDIPVFLQVVAQDRLAHRYRWSTSESTRPAPLFVFSNEQIRKYSDQLDGGISLESGMMMGAVPGIIAHAKKSLDSDQLFPGLRLLVEDSNFHSEVYTLNPRSELQVTKSLSSQETRMLYFQIPEGPVIPFLEDKEQKLIWSELQFISPNVVNVIGPYLE